MAPADIRQRAATALHEAEASRRPIEPLSERYPQLDVVDAYEIQRINRDRRTRVGERVVGHKIGLTSRAMQELLGVSTPDVGSITNRMVLTNNGQFDLSELISGRIEAEFAFVISEPLRSERISVESLKQSISHIALAAEVIDSRIRDWNISLVDTVADNASSARVVVGDRVRANDAVLRSLPSTVLGLYEDGVCIGEGPGSAVLGHPLEALRWLAENLAQQDIHLKPGDIVLAGAVHQMQPLRQGSHYQVQATGFPTVQISTT